MYSNDSGLLTPMFPLRLISNIAWNISKIKPLLGLPLSLSPRSEPPSGSCPDYCSSLLTGLLPSVFHLSLFSLQVLKEACWYLIEIILLLCSKSSKNFPSHSWIKLEILIMTCKALCDLALSCVSDPGYYSFPLHLLHSGFLLFHRH